MSTPVRSQEKFDLNQVRLAGAVARMWTDDQHNVLLRLSTAQGETDEQAHRITLLLPQGCIQGKPVTLAAGDKIVVSGHLEDAPYVEDGRAFIEKSRKARLLADVPGLAEIVTERIATYVIVESLAFAPHAEPANEAVVEGIIVKTWEARGHTYARIAIYDRHTETTARPGKGGRSWRKAHYASVIFTASQVGGRPVALRPKARVRITGHLTERRYTETLAAFLLRARQIGLLATVPNADDVRAVRIQRVATYVEAEHMICFTT